MLRSHLDAGFGTPGAGPAWGSRGPAVSLLETHEQRGFQAGEIGGERSRVEPTAEVLESGDDLVSAGDGDRPQADGAPEDLPGSQVDDGSGEPFRLRTRLGGD